MIFSNTNKIQIGCNKDILQFILPAVVTAIVVYLVTAGVVATGVVAINNRKSNMSFQIED